MLQLITDGLPVDLRERIELALAILGAAGVPFVVQLRAKAADGATLYAAARETILQLDGRAPLVINDRVDVARAAGASGVHLPSRGLPVARVRAAWPEALLGVSAHTPAEVAAAARDGASYVMYGPLSPTPGKPAIGWATLAEAVVAAQPQPLYGIGGLDARDLPRLREPGARLACIRAGLGAPTLAEVEQCLRALADAARRCA